MKQFLFLGSIFSLLYLGATRWFFPGASAGLAWYFGYIASFALAALIAFKNQATSDAEVLMVALKAVLPVSGIILFVYGVYVQFTATTAALGNGDVLNTTSSSSGPLCVVTGIVMVILSLFMMRKS